MSRTLTFFCSLLTILNRVFAVEIAVTFDDHPMPDGALFSLEERVERYCSALEEYGCQAAFFCIGAYCMGAQDPTCLTRLEEAGHFLANHSHSHQHFSELSLDEFKAEIEKADQILCSHGRFRKWFRFPYLDYGNRLDLGGTEGKLESATAVLNRLGYKEAFVTINTFDWHINGALQNAIRTGQRVDYGRLKEVYLGLLRNWCEYYIDAYNQVFPEGIVHVLLLHANDLNALFLADILELFSESGWTLVSPEKAFFSADWREELLKHPEWIVEAPPSLNCQKIDHVLEAYHVFSS